MVIDEKFVQGFKNQIDVLKKLKDAVESASAEPRINTI